MVILGLISIILLIILAIFTSMLKAQRIPIFGYFVDIVILALLMTIYFVGGGLNHSGLIAYVVFLHISSLIYIYLALKNYFIKLNKHKYNYAKKNQFNDKIAKDKAYDFRFTRRQAVYHFLIAIALIAIAKLRLTPEIEQDVLLFEFGYAYRFIIIGLAVIVLTFLIECYRMEKYGANLVRIIVPLGVALWAVISMLLLVKDVWIIVLLAIVVFGFYYVLCSTADMWFNHSIILPIILYSISGILFVIPFLFMQHNQKLINNSLFILILGILIYGLVVINALWKRPLRHQLKILMKYNNTLISAKIYNQTKKRMTSLRLSKYKFYIAMVALIILFTATKILVTPAMKDIAGKDIVALMMLLFFITVVFLVIDIISWLKRKQFVFITIKPLFVFGLYILLFIWVP